MTVGFIEQYSVTEADTGTAFRFGQTGHCCTSAALESAANNHANATPATAVVQASRRITGVSRATP